MAEVGEVGKGIIGEKSVADLRAIISERYDLSDTSKEAVDYNNLADEEKIQIIIAEKQAALDECALQEIKSSFYVARDNELAVFDADARERAGKFASTLSEERTVIELKWRDAEETGTYELPA
jgi:hypothetical protein